jgi:hypothetical protein
VGDVGVPLALTFLITFQIFNHYGN